MASPACNRSAYPEVAGCPVSGIGGVSHGTGHDRLFIVTEAEICEDGWIDALLYGSFPFQTKAGNVHPADEPGFRWLWINRRFTCLRPCDFVGVRHNGFIESVIDSDGLLRVDGVKLVAVGLPHKLEDGDDGEEESDARHKLENMTKRIGFLDMPVRRIGILLIPFS